MQLWVAGTARKFSFTESYTEMSTISESTHIGITILAVQASGAKIRAASQRT